MRQRDSSIVRDSSLAIVDEVREMKDVKTVRVFYFPTQNCLNRLLYAVQRANKNYICQLACWQTVV